MFSLGWGGLQEGATQRVKVVPRLVIELSGQEQAALLEQEDQAQEVIMLITNEVRNYGFDGLTLEVLSLAQSMGRGLIEGGEISSPMYQAPANKSGCLTPSCLCSCRYRLLLHRKYCLLWCVCVCV